MKRAYQILLAVLVTAAATAPSMAQSSQSGVSSIEIRDGKVYVNGEEAEGGEDGKFVIKQDDGKDITIMMDDGTGMVWFGDSKNGSPFRSRAFAGGDGDFRFRLGGGALMDLHDRLNLEAARPLNLFGGTIGQAQIYEHWANSRDSEMRSLEQEIRDLSVRIRRADEDDRSELEAALDQLLFQAFDQKLDGERERIVDMQSRLEEAQNRVDERGASRADIISRRRAQLLGERDKLDW